jgi:hypothetical protein
MHWVRLTSLLEEYALRIPLRKSVLHGLLVGGADDERRSCPYRTYPCGD